MPHLAQWLPVALVVLAGGAFSAAAQTQAAKPASPTSDDCLVCHGEPDAKRANGASIAVSAKDVAASVHGQAGFSCVDCHADLATAELPHAEKLAPVVCATRHDEAVAKYQASVHAEARRAANTAAATCTDCHGTHDIRSSKDPDAPTYHLNLPRTCGRCHGNPEVIRAGKIAIGNVFAQFQDSIHGRALSRAGLLVAPNCGDCHGAHDIKRRTDPGSRVFRTAVPDTCGRCHQGLQRLYQEGIHGASLKAGNPLVPECATCHSAHQIQRVESDSWKLQVIRECGTCHVESIRTYRDTFHGQVTSLGFVRVHADCHGAHDIRRAESQFRVASRLVSTRQKCHRRPPRAFARMTRTPIATIGNGTRSFSRHGSGHAALGVFASSASTPCCGSAPRAARLRTKALPTPPVPRSPAPGGRHGEVR
jgi:hypothetical protein